MSKPIFPLYVAALSVKRELRDYIEDLGSLPYICTKNETMVTLREEHLVCLPYICTKDETMVTLREDYI